MVDRKWERNGNTSLEKSPLVALIIFWHYIFSTSYRDLTVLWLTRELACLYFVADILALDLHCILLFY